MKKINSFYGDGLSFFGKTFTSLSSIDSTNNYLKKLSPVLPDGHAVIADEQLAGRGRQGKSFYSPLDEGLYMSVLIKNPDVISTGLITARVSLAVCRAIDALTGTSNANGVGIKWVNDIYFGGKKLCGILCEKFSVASGNDCVVVGIGVNLKLSKGSLPKDLRGIATSLYDITKIQYDKLKLAKLICHELDNLLLNTPDGEEVISEYKKRSVVIGREISIITEEGSVRAAALDICSNGALLVRDEEGRTRELCGGEITVRLKK